jgi:hypothetical protein
MTDGNTSGALNVNNDQIHTAPANSSFGDVGSNTTDALVVIAEPKKFVPLNPAMFRSAQSGVDSTLKGFLERPYLYANYTLSNTDVAGTFANFRPITALASNTFYKEKMKGRFLAKATVRLILQVNATKFQAGRYILAWVPTAGAEGDATVLSWLKMHRHFLTGITQLPHVELDINKDSQVELVIPYVSHTLGVFPQNATQYGDVGYVFLYPYHPVAAVAGSLEVSASLFIKLDDVELGSVAIPQMAWKGPKKTRQSPLDDEQSKIGPVESTLRGVATLTDGISKVPLLTDFAAPTKWATNIMADIASIWGWSRPSQLGGPDRVISTPMSYNASSNVIDTAQPLALMADNNVAVMTGVGGTDIDEMSIDFLKQIPAYINVLTWTHAMAADTSLLSEYTHPYQYINTTDGLSTLKNYVPMGFLSTYFQLWRGSITYIFKVVKTDFHTGRLMITFTPYNIKMDAVPTLNNANSVYTFREIWDIREKTEFRVTVPFACDTPWLQINTANNRSGKINVSVLDPLQAPATVTSSINILVETCGGPDLQFAVPIRTVVEYPTIPFSQQMSWDGPVSSTIVDSGMIGGSSLSGDGLAESEACIGEKIVSLRPFLKKYTPIYQKTGAQSGDVVFPFLADVALTPGAAVVTAAPQCIPDAYSIFTSIYALSRGGVRLRHFGQNASTGKNVISGSLGWYNGASKFVSAVAATGVTFFQNIAFGSGNPLLLFDAEKSTCGEVAIPQYYHAVARPSASHICNNEGAGTGPLVTNHCVSNLQYTYISDTVYSTRNLLRSGADDLSFHCFVSIPPMFAT